MVKSGVLAVVLLTMLAACGGKPADQADAPPAAPTVAEAPAEAAAPPAAQPASPAPASAATSDGESVDDSTLQISPIAAAVAANTAAPTPTPASFRWKEGVNFKPLPVAQRTSVPPGMVEVVEVFWYGCGHCYALQPHVDSWKAKNKPAYVQLNQMPAIWNPVMREDARLFYTLEALGKLGDLHAAVFREMHVNRNPLTVIDGNRVDTVATERKVREFLLKNGVTAEQFGKTYRSFPVESKIRLAEDLMRRYRVDHTPMVIVNGKYSTDVTDAGGPQQLFQLVNDLAARERGNR